MNIETQKTQASLQKQINLMHKYIEGLQKSNDDRKFFTKKADRFIKMLLRENRTTVDELKLYFTPKPIK